LRNLQLVFRQFSLRPREGGLSISFRLLEPVQLCHDVWGCFRAQSAGRARGGSFGPFVHRAFAGALDADVDRTVRAISLCSLA
jgi:transposase